MNIRNRAFLALCMGSLIIGCGGDDSNTMTQQTPMCDGVMDAEGFCYPRCTNGQCDAGQTCMPLDSGEQICVPTAGGDPPSNQQMGANPNSTDNGQSTNNTDSMNQNMGSGTDSMNQNMGSSTDGMNQDPNQWKPCPTDNHQPQATTIYQVKTKDGFADDTLVVVEGVVTARRLNADGKYSHLVLQVPSDDPGYTGPEKSGVWIYLNGTDDPALQMNPPPEGALVKVHAETSNYFNQLQLDKVVCLEMVNAQKGLPAPVDVTASDVGSGTEASSDLMGRGEELEGVLVRVQNTTVTATEPAAGPGEPKDPNTMQTMPTNEFVLDGVLRVNDFFYLVEPLPAVNTSYSSVSGILRWANANMKLEPRSAADIQ